MESILAVNHDGVLWKIRLHLFWNIDRGYGGNSIMIQILISSLMCLKNSLFNFRKDVIMNLNSINEKILLVPHINGSELKWSLAICGEGCFNLRVCGPEQLAYLALQRIGCIGMDYIGDDEELVFFKSVEHNHPKLKDYLDEKFQNSVLEKLSDTIRNIRKLVPYGDKEKAKKELEEKLKTEQKILLLIYKHYIEKLHNRLDSVLIIRKAIEKYGELNKRNNNPMKETQFAILKEFPLSPLERALLDEVSGGEEFNNKKYEEIEMEKLLIVNDKKTSMTEGKTVYKRFYSIEDEVRSILNDVYNNIQSVDQCVIAVTNPEDYVKEFLKYVNSKGISITFGCGIPIKYSNPGKLLELYRDCLLVKNPKCIKEMLVNEVFCKNKLEEKLKEKFSEKEKFSWDVFCSLLDGLVLTNDLEKSKNNLFKYKEAGKCEGKDNYWNCLMFLAEELALKNKSELKDQKDQVVKFIKEYSVIRGTEEQDKTNKQNMNGINRFNKTLDKKALKIIEKIISMFKIVDRGMVGKRTIRSALETHVNELPSEEGMLHVTNIRDAFFSHRKYLYVAGGHEDNFTGCLDKPKKDKRKKVKQEKFENVIDEELQRVISSFNFADYNLTNADHNLTNTGILDKNKAMCKKLIDLHSKTRVVRWVSFYKQNKVVDGKIFFVPRDSNYEEIKGCRLAIDKKKLNPNNKSYEILNPSYFNEKDSDKEICLPMEIDVGLSKPTGIEDKKWGTLVHNLIEILAASRFVDSGKKDEMRNKLAKEITRHGGYLLGGASAGEVENKLTEVAKNLQNTINQDSEWAKILSSDRNVKVYWEVPYSFKVNEEDNIIRIWSGRIDLVYRADKDNNWHIIDYKTDKGETEDINNYYKNQLNAYKKHAEYITKKGFDARICHIKFTDSGL